MANQKISQMPSLTASELAAGDLLAVVDVSDVTQASSGTNKKITLTALQSAPVTAGVANAVTYLNASKVESSSANLTFDGTTLNASAVTEAGFAAISQQDVGTAPNQVPLNQYLGDLAFMNKDQFVITPASTAAPHQVGAMTFQLTNDTTLVIKVKGSDGVVRSNTLTLV